MEPQYTTARIPSAINDRAVATRASKSGFPSREHGVISAGIQPWNIERSGILTTLE
jgi:hypothetical protein